MTTIESLRAWALSQVGSPYIYGATGAPCTPSYRRARAAQYPEHAQNILKHCPAIGGGRGGCEGCRYKGRPAYDCAQLTRKAMALAGVVLPSGASSQWEAERYALKGPISGDAARQVCLVFRESKDGGRPMTHVGLSLGDGRCVDARSHGDGVVLSDIRAYPWTHWALPEGLSDGKDPIPRMGDRGDAVLQLQLMLIREGHTLPRYGADGVFGQETANALQAFRAKQAQAAGLPPSPAPPALTLESLAQRLLMVEQALNALKGGTV